MKNKKILTLSELIDLGEYDIEKLSEYEEWQEFSPYIQLQYITKAIDNRRKKLTQQLAQLYNVLDYRLKPEVQEAVKNLHKSLKNLEDDKERIFIEFSSKI